MRDNEIERDLGQRQPPLAWSVPPAEPKPIVDSEKSDRLRVWIAVVVVIASLVLLVGWWTVSMSLKK